MTDPDLTHLLDAAAPDDPDTLPAARSAAVRDRADAVTRRNRLAVAAAVIAVAGIGVGVPLAIAGGNDPAPDRTGYADPPSEDGDPTSPPFTAVEPRCPAEAVDVASLGPVEALPDDAAWARVCPATAEIEFEGGGSGAGTAGPVEDLTLTGGVDAFVDGVLALPAYANGDDCATARPGLSPWSIVVGYPDGSTVTLGAAFRMCVGVPVEGTDRKAAAILSLFDDALAGQQTEEATAMPTCPAPANGQGDTLTTEDTHRGSAREIEPADAIVCYTPDPLGSREYAENEGRPTDEQLATLTADLHERLTAEPRDPTICTDTGPVRVMILVDDRGRSLTLTDDRCRGEFDLRDGHWQPSPAAEQVIADVLGGRVR